MAVPCTTVASLRVAVDKLRVSAYVNYAMRSENTQFLTVISYHCVIIIIISTRFIISYNFRHRNHSLYFPVAFRTLHDTGPQFPIHRLN